MAVLCDTVNNTCTCKFSGIGYQWVYNNNVTIIVWHIARYVNVRVTCINENRSQMSNNM